MTNRRIRIERLQISLPRTQISSMHAAQILARSVAMNLATTFTPAKGSSGGRSVGDLEVQVPQSQGSAAGIAHAIQTSLGAAFAKSATSGKATRRR